MRLIGNICLSLLLIAMLVAWAALPWIGVIALLVVLLAWLGLSRSGHKTALIVRISLESLLQRKGAAAVIVVGVAGVVGVLVAMLAMAQGFSETLKRTGSADTAIVLKGGSSSEVMSVLERDSLQLIEQDPHVVRDEQGRPLASSELIVAVYLQAKDMPGNSASSLQMRGVGASARALRPQIKLQSGRWFQPGLNELVIGAGAARRMKGVELGQELRLGQQSWKVVGVFSSADAFESELWTDASILADTYKRGSSRGTVTVRLNTAQDFAAFKAALDSNPALKVEAQTTQAFYAQQSESLTGTMRGIGIGVGAIMAIGAAFAVLNTMYAAIAVRARDIATLRAIGFQRLPVVVATMIEAGLLAALGGVLGSALVWLLFNGHAASTMTPGTGGQVSFAFHVTLGLIGTGMQWALALGLAGGLFPAVKAARAPVAQAIRAN